jgi:hypothetical protein
LKREDSFAEAALTERVIALHRLMPDLLLLDDADTAPFTDDLHKLALVQLMRSEQQLIISQSIIASEIVALKSDLSQSVLLQFVQ